MALRDRRRALLPALAATAGLAACGGETSEADKTEGCLKDEGLEVEQFAGNESLGIEANVAITFTDGMRGFVKFYDSVERAAAEQAREQAAVGANGGSVVQKDDVTFGTSGQAPAEEVTKALGCLPGG